MNTTMRDAVVKAGVQHMVGFNYRFVPAIRYAYQLIQSGSLGTIYHFRARYLQDWLADPKRNRERRAPRSFAQIPRHAFSGIRGCRRSVLPAKH